jgi:putative ABC transport system permease protein
MLKNYFLIAIRHLRNNKIFSLINIVGLGLGMACSLLILLWIKDERNMDKFNTNSSRLYSVFERQYFDNKVDAFHSTPGILADEMKRVLPDIQYASGFAWDEQSTFQVGNHIMQDTGNHAGMDIFKMFSYKLLTGNASTALNTPVKIAISKKMARDFFGSPESAIGKSIRYENRKDLTVSAVYELPENASEKFDYLINWHAFLEDNSWAKEWGNNGPRTYLMHRFFEQNKYLKFIFKNFRS